MKPETPQSESLSQTTELPKSGGRETILFLLSGMGAGLIMFFVFGGIWQVNHFWWVMAAVSLSCGALAAVFRKNFQAMLGALLDNPPSI